MEIGSRDRINFLDLTIIVYYNTIIFDNYNKPTCSGRFLNFYSHHPPCHKNGVVINLVDRILILSHPQFHETNLRNCIRTLLNYCYPLSTIFSIINNRLKYHSHNSWQKKVPLVAADKFFTIPYVKSISESFVPVASCLNKKTAYTIPNTLNKFINRGKDKLNHISQQGVVYKILE
ncbi:hypothetical protein ALC60_06668 [Trachymyrmex zeteki]|uniref:Helix-turn-helix domain-containing protein n=1 Tax=Mycetomoellerius zeteki TaxID=64791 RepID=A0A151X258_9HYME|nr:hypothetical protein ALC60_06668 [Trachymyrmex zeteki]